MAVNLVQKLLSLHLGKRELANWRVVYLRLYRGCLSSSCCDLWYEPRHDKTNKMALRPAKTQISLGIRPVWSESSLCVQWVAKDPSFLHADSEGADQTGWMPRVIWVFAGRTLILFVLSCRGSFYFDTFCGTSFKYVIIPHSHKGWLVFMVGDVEGVRCTAGAEIIFFFWYPYKDYIKIFTILFYPKQYDSSPCALYIKRHWMLVLTKKKLFATLLLLLLFFQLIMIDVSCFLFSSQLLWKRNQSWWMLVIITTWIVPGVKMVTFG